MGGQVTSILDNGTAIRSRASGWGHDRRRRTQEAGKTKTRDNVKHASPGHGDGREAREPRAAPEPAAGMTDGNHEPADARGGRGGTRGNQDGEHSPAAHGLAHPGLNLWTGRDPVIAVDAMGGDYAPDEIVAGALAAQREQGITTLLTGPPARLRPVIARLGAGPELRVVPAEDVVGMNEGALASFRRPRSSIAVACQLVRRGQASAVVSAGSTGAAVATARHRLLSLPGVPRPGIAVVLPTHPNATVLIDAGATADPKPEMLVQFGQLGTAYAQIALGVRSPKVGLLTIGAEPGKGNMLTRRAHELLNAEPQHGAMPLNFVGNVEGGDLMAGVVDVIVTDGFTGNVALKTLEGALRFAGGELRGALGGTRTARIGALLQRRGLRELSERLDTENYGGAALLGMGGTVVIAHGASTARAVSSACALAASLSRGDITERIRQRIGPQPERRFRRRDRDRDRDRL